jgi:L-serine dehydratase
MDNCIERGIKTSGVLPGGLKLERRAKALYESLTTSQVEDPLDIIDWLNTFALAVSEENAAGNQVVTAPTNGAAGIIPAILAYINRFETPLTQTLTTEFFAVSSAIGSLYKMNASISGAEVGCQGETGVACSMAAGALTHIWGGSTSQVEKAAEIAMEHHLGLTCDPVGGLVQVPCIERNAISAVKAINAARMAIKSTSRPKVSLDKIIKTMYQTGNDMNAKYKETSRGGLAINIHMVEC